MSSTDLRRIESSWGCKLCSLLRLKRLSSLFHPIPFVFHQVHVCFSVPRIQVHYEVLLWISVNFPGCLSPTGEEPCWVGTVPLRPGFWSNFLTAGVPREVAIVVAKWVLVSFQQRDLSPLQPDSETDWGLSWEDGEWHHLLAFQWRSFRAGNPL